MSQGIPTEAIVNQTVSTEKFLGIPLQEINHRTLTNKKSPYGTTLEREMTGLSSEDSANDKWVEERKILVENVLTGPKDQDIAKTLSRFSVDSSRNAYAAYCDANGRDLLSGFSPAEAVLVQSAAENYAIREYKRMEEEIRKNLATETDQWRAQRKESINQTRSITTDLLIKYKAQLEQIQKELTGIIARMTQAEQQAGNSADSETDQALNAYNYQNSLTVIKEIVKGIKKQKAGPLKAPLVRDGSIRMEDCGAIETVLQKEPNILRNDLAHHFWVTTDKRAASLLISDAYRIADDFMGDGAKPSSVALYVIENFSAIVGKDLFTGKFTPASMADLLKGDNYPYLREELIRYGIANLLLRNDVKISDENVRERVGQQRQSLVDQVKAKRKTELMEKGDWQKAKEKYDQKNTEKNGSQNDVESAGRILESLDRQEQNLDSEAHQLIESGLELFYSKLFNSPGQDHFSPEKSYLAELARKLSLAVLANQSLYRQGESPVDEEGVRKRNTRLTQLKKSIYKALLPDDSFSSEAEEELIRFFWLYDEQTNNKMIDRTGWERHQYELMQKIGKGDRVDLCDVNETKDLWQSLNNITGQVQGQQKILLWMAENPSGPSRGIYLKKDVDLSRVNGQIKISYYYDHGNEYFHFYLSEDGSIVKVETQDSRKINPPIERAITDPSNMNVFRAIVGQSGKIEANPHKMFILRA